MKLKYTGGGSFYLVMGIPRISEPYLFKASENMICEVKDQDAEWLMIIEPYKFMPVIDETVKNTASALKDGINEFAIKARKAPNKPKLGVITSRRR